ncbi:MAG TPA: hypothetical protein VHL09_14600 [Dehalococcoidia bacterium]|nr:hypothetical protein [Dehalococcoidia bacterium]
MPEYRFERQCRTPSSEVYRISDDGQPVGRVDLHFAAEMVYGTLALGAQLPEEEILTLIEQIDEDLVLAAEVPREDFVVTVYRGEEVGTYSDETFDDEDDEEEYLDDDHR